MPVYVDPVMNHGWSLGPSCHMWADTEPELHNMAKRLGLKRSWHQLNSARKNCVPFSHYDLTVGKHAQAVKFGVIQLDRDKAVARWEEMGFISRDRHGNRPAHSQDKPHPPVHGFKGPFWFLSNFYPCEVRRGEQTMPSAEHMYQAAKCYRPEDWDRIASCPTAPDAKRMGRYVSLRPDWNNVKTKAMYWIVRDKFSREPLRTKLLSTKDAYLEETNDWGDRFWGVCNGVGENNLGKILMEVRSELNREAVRKEETTASETRMSPKEHFDSVAGRSRDVPAAFLDFRCTKCGARFGGTTHDVKLQCPRCGHTIPDADRKALDELVRHLASQSDPRPAKKVPKVKVRRI